MTKEEHIHFWAGQVEEDFECAKVLGKAGYFAQSLFWAHLALEKLCKALWIKHNESNVPPFTHDLVKLILKTPIELDRKELQVLADMNLFQRRGRYPVYLQETEEEITESLCIHYLRETEKMIACPREKLH